MGGAVMRAFAARADCAVLEEPFLAAWLAETGAEHPLREAILATGETDPDCAAALCMGGPPEGRALLYQRHAAHHMLPGFPRLWMDACANVFLIRHPARVAASWGAGEPPPPDLGYGLLEELFRTASVLAGAPALVADVSDIRAGPEAALRALCARLELPFDPAMLHPPRGGGIPAPEGPLPPLGGSLHEAAARAMPHYARLQELAI